MVPSLYRRYISITVHITLCYSHLSRVRDPMPVTQLDTELPEARDYV